MLAFNSNSNGKIPSLHVCRIMQKLLLVKPNMDLPTKRVESLKAERYWACSLAIGWESMGIDAAVIRGLACTGYIICILHYITATDRVHLSDEHRCGFLLVLTHAPGPSSHNYFFSPINSLQFFISFQIV